MGTSLLEAILKIHINTNSKKRYYECPHGSIRWPLALSARAARVSKGRPALTTSGHLSYLIFRIGINLCKWGKTNFMLFLPTFIVGFCKILTLMLEFPILGVGF